MHDFGAEVAFARLWDQDEALPRLREAFAETTFEVQSFRGEQTIVVPVSSLLDVLAFLRDDPECAFDFLTDVTVVHWPNRPQPFELVHLLYSLSRNKRLRIKTRLGEEPVAPSVVSIWPTANWLERECFDMFGVSFEGHPDPRRILMPDDFEGWPLRKAFPLKC